MKTYFSALIEKSVSAENTKLSRKLQMDLKKSLDISSSNVTANMHNALIFLRSGRGYLTTSQSISTTWSGIT